MYKSEHCTTFGDNHFSIAGSSSSGPYLSLLTDAEADDVETDSLAGIKPIEDSFDVEVEKFMKFDGSTTVLAEKIQKRFSNASD